MTATWAQALAWRWQRHLLDPVDDRGVGTVVGRLGAVPAYPEAAADLAVGARRTGARQGDVPHAVASGEVFKAYAFRGATHLMTPQEGGVYLALRASSRMWELPSWESHYGLSAADWPRFREAVRGALAEGPLTRDELAAAVTGIRRYHHLGFAFDDTADTLLKPLAWQGDMCFGPPREGRATYQRLDQVPGWAGVPVLDEAGPRAVAAYFATYGPATEDRVLYWLGEGLGAGRKAIRSWLSGLGDRLVTVRVEGEDCRALEDDVDAITTAGPSDALRLLPPQDQWVMGPGTKDPHVVPPARRSLVTRGAAVVVRGGTVTGTWSTKGDRLTVGWFEEAGRPPRDAIAAEADRLATFWDRAVELEVYPVEQP